MKLLQVSESVGMVLCHDIIVPLVTEECGRDVTPVVFLNAVLA